MLKICCDYLELHGLKIAFIESASAGYLASQFALYKNSGANILIGGLVCYDPWVKQEILKIPNQLIHRYSAESLQVTEAMAAAGQHLFPCADIVVACTGLLKPGGSASIDKPEGTFFISLSYQGDIITRRYCFKHAPTLRLNALISAVCQLLMTTLQQNLATR
jgi:nicotinamide-nucleotide amidase